MEVTAANRKWLIARRVTIVVMVAASLFVLVIPSPNPLFLWSALPILGSFGWLLRLLRRRESFPLVCGAAAGVLVTSGYIIRHHVAWLVDPQLTAIGSSTAAVSFLIVPIEALFVGGATFIACALVLFGVMMLRTRQKTDKLRRPQRKPSDPSQSG